MDVRDADRNRPNDADYDPRTLFVPASAWSKFTPFEKQFWEIKSKNWDSIVFFKKGKFYELYEKDADVGHQEFDLKLTDRTNMRMVGVPESSFDHWVAQFIAKGYKVARVDQMENAIGKAIREKKEITKADKVIRRELTSVLTAGTLVDAALLTDDLGTYCMSIKEYCPGANANPEYGICFVDTSTAEFNLVSFVDDQDRTKFRTLIMQIRPRELVTEKNRLSGAAMRILKDCLANPLWNVLTPETEFWDGRVTIDEIRIGAYFTTDDNINMDSIDDWPSELKEMADKQVLMSAVGGLLWYLRSIKLDKDLFSAGNIRQYDPVQNATRLVLDGQTLANLEIFENSYDGTSQGTVYKLLANSVTPFGKRLFTRWLCHPLRLLEDITQRQDAVDDLLHSPDLQDTLAAAFKELPDLERLISRVHSKHCKVKEFLSVLDGFQNAKKLIAKLKEFCPGLTSKLLQTLIQDFPLMTDALDYFSDAFVVAEIEMDYQKTTAIIPKTAGINEEWDKINKGIKDMENGFQQHLQDMKRELKCPRLVYKDMGKEIYQLEAPKGFKVPKDWQRMSTTSKVDRYWNPTLSQMVPDYKEQLEIKSSFIKNFASQVYAEFDGYYRMWLAAVDSLAQLDALLGLARGSARIGSPSCRPVFVDQEKSMISFEELRHPCVTTSDFIPNDTKLGGSEANIMVLTGPNMGGKSTLLRQTCIAIIMAQLGGYVPAQSCTMTPCDRIYTRIGANDNILAGQSTFMVELSETSKILHEATPRSMVILDELGRGTSTFDGLAIAYAVLHYLAMHVGCLTMFSTHYHTLCQEFSRHPAIRNMHM
ncbi:hypothetical protein DM01DRAFT_208046 [Hesseltinella vesiculosa]|uniref:DNA mismatch repair proteins mutS family domain-containing protein n=1 Tax=Hesseltinella vesiculosa TaxID=101127 RepID=A0A1X2GZJ9_9FUNG|nr:hypothetical protein DM01DRAFT_208046 [Hesseltinella vesiculosa]